ncbi:MAG: endonuclease/exonuclease/phosphatase family protein [Candidatus Shapirobacteria bacterium]|jgi:endonuclease/exonuclease/phosphatase family metal-dependent hydrolase|nr:endonuclease/exonuclease/phosphatase family protein [Candidatus Shapirobacteria bacterium]
MNLKVITLNCFDSPLSSKRTVRINHLISEVIKLKADVICFQELIFLKRVKRIAKVFENNGYYTFTTPGKRINRGGLFFASRFPIVSGEYKKYKNQATLFSLQLSDRVLKKGYQKVTLEIEGKKMTVVNTHLVSLYKNVSPKERKILLKQFSELLEALKVEGESTIVAGDFNIEFTESIYRELDEKTNLYDPLRDENLVTVSKENSQRKNFYKIKRDKRLDYILISKDLKYIGYELILEDLYRLNKKNIHLSDHFGLMMEVVC